MWFRKSKKVYLNKAQARSIERHDAKQQARNGNPSYGRFLKHGGNRSGSWEKNYDPYGKNGRYTVYKYK